MGGGVWIYLSSAYIKNNTDLEGVGKVPNRKKTRNVKVEIDQLERGPVGKRL